MREFSDCECSAVDPGFKKLVHLEITVNELSPELPLQNIPKEFPIYDATIKFEVAIILRNAHFFSVASDGNGGFLKYDDTSKEIESVESSYVVNPQHLIMFNKT